MRFARLIVSAALLAPAAWGANKEMIELSRDVAQLQDQVRTLQRSFDERMSGLQVLVQQALDASIKANNSVAVLNDRMNTGLRDLSTNANAPAAALGSKLDGVQQDVQALRESVSDLSARMGRLQQQLTDVNLAIKAGQVSQPAPPPTDNGALTPPGTRPLTRRAAPEDTDGPAVEPSVPAGNSAPPVQATTLYDNAKRDMGSGKTELALNEFQDYLKYYGTTEMAPNAQFYVGYIRYSQDQYDKAIVDFDRVLLKFPENNKTPDAHFMKGKALFQLGQRTKAAAEFRVILEKYPSSEVAASAKLQLRALGLNPPAPSATRRRR